MTYQQIDETTTTLSMLTNQPEDELPKTYAQLISQLEEKGILFEEFWAALATAQELTSKVNDEGE